MTKILLTSVGTFGDLNPMICFAKFLKEENFDVTIAAAKYYEKSIKAAGIPYIQCSPDYNPSDSKLAKKILNPYLTLYYIHKVILNKTQLENGINDILKITKNFDVVIGNVFAYHARIACLINETPWVSFNLSPTCFFSSYDPPYLYPLFYFKLRSQILYKYMFKYLFKLVDFWGREVHRAYKKHNLETSGNLLLETPFSQQLNIALFPSSFCKPAKDWPENTIQTPFFNYSGENESLAEELMNFIGAGSKPILITFGSVTIHKFDDIKKLFLGFIKKTNHRFVITTHNLNDAELLQFNEKEERIFLCHQIPYTSGMKLMSGVIHQGGIGTTACALSANIPQLIVPSCTDQFDNGFRVKKLGLGDVFTPIIKTDKKFFQMAKNLFNNPNLNLQPVSSDCEQIITALKKFTSSE